MQEADVLKGMHLGAKFNRQVPDTTFRRQMTFFKQLGVEYVSATPPRGWTREMDEEGHWDADSLARFREYVESFGIKLGAMRLPMLKWPSIMLGTPERDRDIEHICKCIEAVGKAGVPLLGYHWPHINHLSVVRCLGWTTGRGGIMHQYFDYEKVKDNLPHPAGPITAEQAWERIEYFMKCVIPVAEEYKVKMACHPTDPAMPVGVGYRGIASVLSNIDGLKHLIDLYPSEYNGILFCQGCVAEASTDPKQVYEAIRYFGERKKILWVHFRNIRGGFLKFEEVLPDEGNVDMAEAMRTYKEVGYNGVLVPDHVPYSDLDTLWGHNAHAFCYGYIRALIQAVESEN